MTERICTTCGEMKPAEDFHRDSRRTDGRRTSCKVCRTEAVKRWYHANQERQATRQRARYAANVDQMRNADRERYVRERDARTEYAKRVSHERRAAAAGCVIEPDITIAALRSMYGDECHYCQKSMSFEVQGWGEMHPDRATYEHLVPISKGGGHTWENVRLACWACNMEKRSQTADEFIQDRAG